MKKVLYITLGTLVVAVGGVAAYVSSIDPNQFKPMISEQVKKATGQELVIAGNIEWQLFPTLGLKVGKTSLKNPQDFAQENFVQFDSAQASVDLLPIFSKHIAVGDISLNGARIFMQTKRDGVSNLEVLQKDIKATQATNATQAKQAPAQTAEPSTQASEEEKSALAALNGWQITLAGLELSNAGVLIQNDIDNSVTELSEFNFKLDRFALDQWTNITFDLKAQAGGLFVDAKGKSQLNIASDFSKASLRDFSINKSIKGDALPKKKMDVAVQGAFDFDVQKSSAQFSDIVIQADNLKMYGTSSVRLTTPLNVRFDFKTDDMDLDNFLNLNAKQEDAKSQPQQTAQSSNDTSNNASQAATASESTTTFSKVEPDVSALKSIDLAGSLVIPKIKMMNVITTDIKTDVEIKKGVAKLKRFTANLYQGNISSSASLNVNPHFARYDAKFNLTGVQIEQLLRDFTQKDQVRVTGNTNAKITLNGDGLSPYRSRVNSNGVFDLSFKNGSIYGANLPQIIYDAERVIKGEKSVAVLKPKSTDFTDFGSLTTTMQLSKGVLSTNNLLLDSAILNVQGKGQTNIVSTALDFVTDIRVVGSVDGMQHDSMERIKKYHIPVQFSGTWAQASYQIKIDQLLSQIADEKIDKEVDRQLDKLNLDDDTKAKAKDLLGGLKKLF